jgi:hypothetical protein
MSPRPGNTSPRATSPSSARPQYQQHSPPSSPTAGLRASVAPLRAQPVSPAKGSGRPAPPPLTISSISSTISTASTAPGGIGSTIRATQGTVGAVGTAIRSQQPSGNAAGAVGTTLRPGVMGQQAGQPMSPRQQQQQQSPAGYSPRALADYSTSAATSVASTASAMQRQQRQMQAQYGSGASGASSYDPNSIIEVARQQYASDSRGNTGGGGY